jgi:hypothetical protein
MTRYRVQVWDDDEQKPSYITETFPTRDEAERAARKCLDGLPCHYEVEEETAVDYLTLLA